MKAIMAEYSNTILSPLVLGGTTPLALMPRVFAWHESDETLEQVRSWYFKWARRETLRIFDEIERADPNTDRQLHRWFEELPNWAQVRFLSAPETYNRAKTALKKDPAGLGRQVPFFMASLKAERMLSRIDDSRETCWSALGDFYFAGSVCVDPRRDEWDAKSSFAAPRVGGVPIDFASPYSRYVNSMADCPFEPYTPAETVILYENLEKAFESVSAISKPAAQLFQNFVAVIVPRKNPLRPRNSGSSSTPSHVGRLLLRNGHLMDCARQAESLVHEAIHSILDVLETSEPFADHPEQPCDNIPVRSPWSNNEIPLRIYVHACYVWYGLVKFWKAARQTDVFPQEVVNERFALALSGFRGADPAERLLPYKETIRPATLEVTSSLRCELQESGDLD